MRFSRFSFFKRASRLSPTMAAFPVAPLVGAARVTGMLWRWLGRSPKHAAKVERIRSLFNKYGPLAGLGFFLWGSYYYCSHLEATPVTHRVRFLGHNMHDEDFREIVESTQQALDEQYKNYDLRDNHPIVPRVKLLMHKLEMAACTLYGDIMRDVELDVSVIDADVMNAMVLPNGKVYIYRGLLQRMDEGAVAFCLAHELGHFLLQHGAEKLSEETLISVPQAVGSFFIGSTFGIGLTEMIAQYLMRKGWNVMTHLPYSRALELEADHVGLMLAVRSCYDEDCAHRCIATLNEYGHLSSPFPESAAEQEETQETRPLQPQPQAAIALNGASATRDTLLPRRSRPATPLPMFWSSDMPKTAVEQSELKLAELRKLQAASASSPEEDISATPSKRSPEEEPAPVSSSKAHDLSEWFRTHPNHERRHEELDRLLPIALHMRREDCLCHNYTNFNLTQ